MSSETKIELNDAGIRELMKSQAMVNCIEDHARRIAKNCGGTVGRTFQGNTRALDSVFSDKDDNSLLHALR